MLNRAIENKDIVDEINKILNNADTVINENNCGYKEILSSYEKGHRMRSNISKYGNALEPESKLLDETLKILHRSTERMHDVTEKFLVTIYPLFVGYNLGQYDDLPEIKNRMESLADKFKNLEEQYTKFQEEDVKFFGSPPEFR